MAQTYAPEVAVLAEVPPGKLEGYAQGARKRTFTATITLASQAADDTIVLAKVPKGMRFSVGRLTASATLGTATVAIGTAASAGKYRAAATFTAANTPTSFGTAAAMAAGRLTADEVIIATIGTAALPSSGTLVVELDFVAA